MSNERRRVYGSDSGLGSRNYYELIGYTKSSSDYRFSIYELDMDKCSYELLADFKSPYSTSYDMFNFRKVGKDEFEINIVAKRGVSSSYGVLCHVKATSDPNAPTVTSSTSSNYPGFVGNSGNGKVGIYYTNRNNLALSNIGSYSFTEYNYSNHGYFPSLVDGWGKPMFIGACYEDGYYYLGFVQEPERDEAYLYVYKVKESYIESKDFNQIVSNSELIYSVYNNHWVEFYYAPFTRSFSKIGNTLCMNCLIDYSSSDDVYFCFKFDLMDDYRQENSEDSAYTSSLDKCSYCYNTGEAFYADNNESICYAMIHRWNSNFSSWGWAVDSINSKSLCRIYPKDSCMIQLAGGYVFNTETSEYMRMTSDLKSPDIYTIRSTPIGAYSDYYFENYSAKNYEGSIDIKPSSSLTYPSYSRFFIYE